MNVKGLETNSLLKTLSNIKSGNKSVLVIRSVRKLNAEAIKLIKNETDIKAICTISSGFDNIDLEACNRYKIKILNVHGGNSISTAEHTFSLILSAVKSLIIHNNNMKRGKFEQQAKINIELFDKTLGIIGVGRVGSQVAKYARAFGMKVAGNDINPKLKNKYKWIRFTSLENLLKVSDIVTVHTPLDELTYKMINKKNIKLLKPNSIVINCARGGIIDELSLIEQLKKNKITYAGLDVFENEPDFNLKFLDLKNVILTPHVAGKTVESKKRMSEFAARNIIKFIG